MGEQLWRFGHAIETNAGCRAMMKEHHPHVICHTDILNWLPPTVRAACVHNGRPLNDFAALRSLIMDENCILDLTSGGDFCYDFGVCHVAGPPCVDFSTMGKRKRFTGPSNVLFLVWAQGIRQRRPLIIFLKTYRGVLCACSPVSWVIYIHWMGLCLIPLSGGGQFGDDEGIVFRHFVGTFA